MGAVSGLVPVEALADDHRNDVVTNALGAAAMALAVEDTAHLWLCDPLGAVLLALWIVYSWAGEGAELVREWRATQKDKKDGAAAEAGGAAAAVADEREAAAVMNNETSTGVNATGSREGEGKGEGEGDGDDDGEDEG